MDRSSYSAMKTFLCLLVVAIALAVSQASPINSIDSECDERGTVYSQIDGHCHKLATQGPCQDGSWFVMSNSTLTPLCSARPCSPDYAFYNGSCLYQYSHACPLQGEALVHNIFGKARCGCREGWGEHEGGCWQEFTTGLCRRGRVLIRKQEGKNRIKRFFHEEQISSVKKLVSSSTVNLKCSKNPCGSSTDKLMWTDGRCHQAVEDLEGCEVELRGQDLACVPEVVPFAIGPSAIAARKKCRRCRVWNTHRQRCVRNWSCRRG